MSSPTPFPILFQVLFALLATPEVFDVVVSGEAFMKDDVIPGLDSLQRLSRKYDNRRAASPTAWMSESCPGYCDKPPEETHGITPQCYCDVCQYNEDLGNRKTYAMEMFDSQGRFPSGLLELNLKWTGTYTECRRVRDVVIETNTIDGQYCLVGVFPMQENTTVSSSLIDIGICVPNSCSEEDVRKLLKEDLIPLSGLVALLNLPVNLMNVFCTYDNGLSTGAIVMICITGVLLLLVICGSSYEQYKLLKTRKTEEYSPTDAVEMNFELRKRLEKDVPTADNTLETTTVQDASGTTTTLWEDYLVSFSVISNGARILDARDVDSEERGLLSLHGIRVISLIWMILGQSLLLAAEFFCNPLNVTFILEFALAQPAVYFMYCEDTLLLLSGFLVTYYCVSRIQTHGKGSWVQYYIHCIWKLSPAYYLALFAFMYMAEYFMDGPLKFYHYRHMDTCYENWWANVLYINNLYPFPGNLAEQCGYWFWFLACLMQFYIVTPFIIIALVRRPAIGISVIVALVAVCVGCTVSLAAYYDTPVSVAQVFQGYVELENIEELLNQHIHSKPYTRMTPYLVGMLIAYVLVARGREYKIHKLLSFLIWCVALFTIAAVLLGLYSTFHGTVLSRGVTLLHQACRKLGFSLAVGWIVFACVTDHGGFINRFLSWKGWIPLSRLSFGAYLIHAFVMCVYLYCRDNLVYFSYINVAGFWVGSVFGVYFAAFFFVLVTEKPFRRLEHVSWRRWSEWRAKSR